VAAAPDEQARAFLGLMAGTGLRISEGLGLRRGDLSATTVAVAQQMCEGRVGPPKTRAGERVVPVLPEYREHLDAARLLAAGRDPEALVFTTRRGRPLGGSEAMPHRVV
jgi:integrase